MRFLRPAFRQLRHSCVALACVATCIFGLAVAPTARAEVGTQYQLETDLTCQCGCGLTVHSCNHLNCGSGIPLKKEIAAQLETGQSREEILSHFEHKYGEKILSSPTARGFNIAAWTVPFVVIALGGLLVGIVLTRWRRSPARADTTQAPRAAEPNANPELRARLQRELDDLERRS